MALAVDAVIGRREDVAGLPECGGGLVEAEAERDEAVGRGLRNGPFSEPSTVRPFARDPRVLIGWQCPLGLDLAGRSLLDRRGRVCV